MIPPGSKRMTSVCLASQWVSLEFKWAPNVLPRGKRLDTCRLSKEGLRIGILCPAVLHRSINFKGAVGSSVRSCLAIVGGGERRRVRLQTKSEKKLSSCFNSKVSCSSSCFICFAEEATDMCSSGRPRSLTSCLQECSPPRAKNPSSGASCDTKKSHLGILFPCLLSNAFMQLNFMAFIWELERL